MTNLNEYYRQAKELELKEATVNGYYQYIIDSLINGQRKQVIELFNDMHEEEQEYFLINWLENDNGYHTSCKNICIGELINNK